MLILTAAELQIRQNGGPRKPLIRRNTRPERSYKKRYNSVADLSNNAIVLINHVAVLTDNDVVLTLIRFSQPLRTAPSNF